MNTITNTLGKRKTYDQRDIGIFGQPPARKVPVKRGALNVLLDQPSDIVDEIFSHLDPPDLTKVSRISKPLRALLLSRSATSIWKASISNIPGLPECPDDISHPRYAELVFGKTCHFCWKGHPTRIHISWSARVRACNACANEEFHRVSCEDRPYSGQLFALLPTAPSTSHIHFTVLHTPHNKIVLKTVDLALYEEFQEVKGPARGQWEADKIEELKAIHAHADRCRAWVSGVEMLRRKELEARKAPFLERLITLGWGRELDLISDSDQHPENHKDLLRICRQPPPTQKSVDKLEATLVNHMQGVQKLRLTNERWIFLPPRLKVLKDFYTSIKPTSPNTIYPTTAEIFRIPATRSLIDSVPATSPFTKDHLRPLIHQLPKLMVWWQHDMQLKLLNLICGKFPTREYREDTFNLATSIFSCSRCSRILRHPSVLVHACATVPLNLQEDGDLDGNILASTLRETFWNLNGVITVNAEHVGLLSHLLSLAGLSSTTTTIGELSAREPIFECISCNDERLGRATMTWARALVHRFSPDGPHQHVHQLILLEESEAQIIRARMMELRDRALRRGFLKRQMMCLQCQVVSEDYVALQHHVRTTHGIFPPNQCIQFCGLDVDYTYPVYRHWPPRFTLA